MSNNFSMMARMWTITIELFFLNFSSNRFHNLLHCMISSNFNQILLPPRSDNWMVVLPIHGNWSVRWSSHRRKCCLVVHVLSRWTPSHLLPALSPHVLSPWQRNVQRIRLRDLRRCPSYDHGPVRPCDNWDAERCQQVRCVLANREVNCELYPRCDYID